MAGHVRVYFNELGRNADKVLHLAIEYEDLQFSRRGVEHPFGVIFLIAEHDRCAAVRRMMFMFGDGGGLRSRGVIGLGTAAETCRNQEEREQTDGFHVE